MRGCRGRITAPGKVSGSRRFYVINPGYRLERWSGGDGDRLCPKEAVPGIGETAPDARLATRRGAASSSTSATSAIRIELAQR